MTLLFAGMNTRFEVRFRCGKALAALLNRDAWRVPVPIPITHATGQWSCQFKTPVRQLLTQYASSLRDTITDDLPQLIAKIEKLPAE